MKKSWIITALIAAILLFGLGFFLFPPLVGAIMPDDLKLLNARMAGITGHVILFAFAVATIPIFALISIYFLRHLGWTRRIFLVIVLAAGGLLGLIMRTIMLRSMIAYRSSVMEEINPDLSSYFSIDDLNIGEYTLAGIVLAFVSSFFFFRKKAAVDPLDAASINRQRFN